MWFVAIIHLAAPVSVTTVDGPLWCHNIADRRVPSVLNVITILKNFHSWNQLFHTEAKPGLDWVWLSWATSGDLNTFRTGKMFHRIELGRGFVRAFTSPDPMSWFAIRLRMIRFTRIYKSLFSSRRQYSRQQGSLSHNDPRLSYVEFWRRTKTSAEEETW